MINTITLNPAIDCILFIDRFERNVTARIREKKEALGGKGAHISVNLALLGEQNQAFGILFGETGKKIEGMINDAGVTPRFVYGESGNGRESRTNYVVIEESGGSTIVAEQGSRLSDAEVRSVLEALLADTEKDDVFVFSGDASNVDDPYVYNRFIEALGQSAGKVYVDASGPALKKALEAAPFLIKPNRGELEEVTGIEIKNDADAIRAISSLDSYGIGNIALTLGDKGAIVRFKDGSVLRADAPFVTVKNTAGCGDAFLSGFIAGIERGWDSERTLRLATAVSAATAADPLTVGFSKEYADSLMDKVNIKSL